MGTNSGLLGSPAREKKKKEKVLYKSKYLRIKQGTVEDSFLLAKKSGQLLPATKAAQAK